MDLEPTSPAALGIGELMPVLLAIGAAIGWGASDFLGGAVRRETPVLVVVCLSEVLGLVVLIPILLVRGVPLPTDPRILLACLAGLAATVELSLIYMALSRGEAFITAPVGALGAAAAVVVGLLSGDPLNLTIAAGLVCALLGGSASAWTSGSQTHSSSPLRSAAVCAGAAAGVATMLICFHAAGRIDPVWATAAEHASTAVCAALVVLAIGRRRRRPALPARDQFPGLSLLALAGVAGDMAYALASRHGALSIVSAISSLYPLTTVVLGAVVQGHRAGRVRGAAIALALVGAALLGA